MYDYKLFIIYLERQELKLQNMYKTQSNSRLNANMWRATTIFKWSIYFP